jgi:hypothetical protein
MTYKLFEIPSESGSHADIVWADLENPDGSISAWH